MIKTRKQNGLKYVLRYCLGICVGQPNKPKYISMKMVQDLSAGPFKYEAGMLTTQPKHR